MESEAAFVVAHLPEELSQLLPAKLFGFVAEMPLVVFASGIPDIAVVSFALASALEFEEVLVLYSSEEYVVDQAF